MNLDTNSLIFMAWLTAQRLKIDLFKSCRL